LESVSINLLASSRAARSFSGSSVAIFCVVPFSQMAVLALLLFRLLLLFVRLRATSGMLMAAAAAASASGEGGPLQLDDDELFLDEQVLDVEDLRLDVEDFREEHMLDAEVLRLLLVLL